MAFFSNLLNSTRSPHVNVHKKSKNKSGAWRDARNKQTTRRWNKNKNKKKRTKKYNCEFHSSSQTLPLLSDGSKILLVFSS